MAPTQPEDFETALELVRQRRLRRDWAMTAEERLTRFERLQSMALETLQSNPRSYALFVRQNHRRRRKSQVLKLEAKMLMSTAAKT